MVEQPIYYYRFEPHYWTNPTTGEVLEYYDLENRYFISDWVTYYTVLDDVDFKPDSVKVNIKKSFFTNPTNNSTFKDGEIDSENAFSPTSNHVIVIGKQPSDPEANYSDVEMTVGVVKTANEDQGIVEIECYSFLKNLADIQAGADFSIRKDLNVGIGAAMPADDNPNELQLYYEEIPFQTTLERSLMDFWNRNISSDPAFPTFFVNGKKYPYSVYTISGKATQNGTLTLLFMKDDGATSTQEIMFYIGNTGEYIVSQLSDINLGSNIRVTVKNNCILCQSLSQDSYLSPFESSVTPITITNGDGILTDYVYVGKTDDATANITDGRMTISPMYEKNAISEEDYPFYPLSMYNVEHIETEYGTKTVRKIYGGYSSYKIAWRMLQSLGWCREPFFDDMNPYCEDYIDEIQTKFYDEYSSDGLNFDFGETDYGDGIGRRNTKFYSSFNTTKQAVAYNLKTLSDGLGMYINSTFVPKLEDYAPVWDVDIYNRPTWATIDVEGSTNPFTASTISVSFPFIEGGSLTTKTITLSNLVNISRKEIALRIETAILAIDGIEDYYRIIRRGTRIYMETFNQTLADVSRFSVSVTSPSKILLYLNTQQARTVGWEREEEKVFYLRKWGIFAGFHPKINIRMSPNLKITPPATEMTLEYGGTNKRDDSTDTPSVVSTPTWTLDDKDMINRVIIQYESLSDSSNNGTYIVFPYTNVQYRYIALRLTGATSSGMPSMTLKLTVTKNGTEYVANVVRNIDTYSSAKTVAALFDQTKVMTFNNGASGPIYYLSASGETIFIQANTNEDALLLKDVSQLSVIFNSTDLLTVFSKELVMDEPAEFIQARDSQSRYGVKELSMTLPEMTSINDAMDFSAMIFRKYMYPKDRCVCEVTQTSEWHIPLFTYTNVVDYTNYDTTSRDVPWYVEAVISEKSSVNQNILCSFMYSNGVTRSSGNISILASDAPEDVTAKIAESTSGELVNFTMVVKGNKITFVPSEDLSSNYTLIKCTIRGLTAPIVSTATVCNDLSYSQTVHKDKKLVLMRIESDSRKGTYTCTFGLPMEDSANIVNQINTWIGDVEKSSASSTSSTSSSYTPDADTFVASDWIIVGDGSSRVSIDGTNGSILNTGNILSYGELDTYEGLYTLGTFKADGNEICHLSGTTPPTAIVASSIGTMTYDKSASAYIPSSTTSAGTYIIAYVNGSNQLIVLYTSGESWSTSIVASSVGACMDISVYGENVYIAYASADKASAKICKLDRTGAPVTSFGSSGFLTVSPPSGTVEGIRFKIRNDSNIHVALESLYSGVYYITYMKYSSSGYLSSASVTNSSTIYSFDLEECRSVISETGNNKNFVTLDYIFVAVSYTVLGSYYTRVYSKSDTSTGFRLESAKPFPDKRVDKIGLSSYETVSGRTTTNVMTIWGIDIDKNILMASTQGIPSLSWYYADLTNVDSALTTTGFISADVKDGVGFLMIESTSYPSKMTIFKIPNIDVMNIDSSKISSYFQTDAITSPVNPHVTAISSSSAFGNFNANSDMYSSFASSTINPYINAGKVYLSDNDKVRDYLYYYRDTLLTNGYIQIPFDGKYSISWQIYRSAGTAATATIMHRGTEIMGDFGTGYLKGTMSALQMKAGDLIYMNVSDNSIANWNNLAKCFLDVYMVSSD